MNGDWDRKLEGLKMWMEENGKGERTIKETLILEQGRRGDDGNWRKKRMKGAG